MAKRVKRAASKGLGKLPASASGKLKAMEAAEFVRSLRLEHDRPDTRFAFFLGAGCSVTSGIDAAAKLVRTNWLPRLHSVKSPAEKDAEKWAAAEFGYDPNNPAASYGEVLGRLFGNPESRQREIERLCASARPFFGYAVLAQLMARERGDFNVTLTTNFDDLVSDALYLYTPARPLVINHESLAAYIRPTRTRPLVVKLHGDNRLSPRNTALETARIEEAVRKQTAMLLNDRGLIFMGYAGSDVGIHDMLESLPPEALPLGVYWVHREEPTGSIRRWLEARNGTWVKGPYFDEMMLLFHTEFKLSHPSGDRFTKIFTDYQEAFQKLSKQITERPAQEAGAAALKAAVEQVGKTFPDFWAAVAEAYRLEQTDADQAERVYKEGIKQFPDAAPLIGNFALFLENVRKRRDEAETTYKLAIEADPEHANNLGNYALFLERGQRLDEAEEYYKEAIKIDPRHANSLGNYALFLDNQNRAVEAEIYYKRAIEADPRQANNLGNYALFLEKNERHDEAEAYYKRAVEADPKHANNLGNYALFLADVRKREDDAEAMFDRALEVDPKHANNLTAYALFLEQTRGKLNDAEAYYKRAVEADPKHAILRGNYARFLLAHRDLKSGLDMLRTAINSLDPVKATELDLECWMYAYCCLAENRDESLQKLKALVTGTKLRTGSWDFSGVIAKAKALKHPEFPWLEKLAAVLSAKAKPATLDGWEAWNKA